jgi:hypothetical protein
MRTGLAVFLLVFEIALFIFLGLFVQYATQEFPFQPPTPNIPIVLSHYISAEKSYYDQSNEYLDTQQLNRVLSPSEMSLLRSSPGLLSNPPQITVTTNPPRAKEKYVCIIDNYEVSTNSYTYIAVALVDNHLEIYHGPYQPGCAPSLTNPSVINDYRRM